MIYAFDVQAPLHTAWLKQLLLANDYRKTSSISRTKSQNLTVSRVVLPLSLPNPLKPGVKSSMKM